MNKKEMFKKKNSSRSLMEYSLLYHTIIPFALSSLAVILVTIIAEKYGTKKQGKLWEHSLQPSSSHSS